VANIIFEVKKVKRWNIF